MKRGSLYDFSPRNTGLYEARLWKAYYDRNWPLALSLVFRLLRSQFNLSPLQAAQATYYSICAAIAWSPRINNGERVQALLTRFYAVLRDATGAEFDPEVAGAAEFEYWAVHRCLDGQKDQPELIDALTKIAAEVYSLPTARARPAGAARARACDLVDDITTGRQAPTREAWVAVEAALREAYSRLREEVTGERRATAQADAASLNSSSLM
jgi:hypothetical protein